MAKKNNDPRAKPPQPAKPDLVEDIEIVEGSSKKLPKPAAPMPVEDVLEDIEIVEGSSKKLPRPVEDVSADVIEDVEVLEGSSKKLPQAATAQPVEDVLDDVELLPGSSKKMPRPVESMEAEEVSEDALDVEVVPGSSLKMSRPIADTSEDALDVEVVPGSSQRLAYPVEEIASEILAAEAVEGSSQKLAKPVHAGDEDVMDVEVLEGSSRKMALPVEEIASDILAAEVVEGSSKKLAPPHASDEDVMDVEVVEGSSRKMALPVEEIASDIVEGAEEVPEKRPTGPLMPKSPSAKIPPLSPDVPEAKKSGGKPTAMGPKKAAATRIASKGVAPTMLAGKQEADELTDSGLGGPAAGGKAGDEDVMEDVLDVTEVAPSGSSLRVGPDDVDILDEEILVEGSSEVGLDKKGAQGPVSSGVDMIAEALESGVDLAHDSSKTRASKRPAPQDVNLDKLEPDADSSAVDLGSSATLPAMHSGVASDVVDVTEEVVDVTEEVVDVTGEAGDSGKLWGDDKPKSRLKVTAKKETSVDPDEEIAEAMEDDDILVTPKTKTTGKTKAGAEDEDEELVVPKTKAKVGKSKVVIEEEEELVVTPGKKTRTKTVTVGAAEEEAPARGRAAKPERLSLAGALFGGLLWLIFFLAFVIVAAAAGIWYIRPDLLKEIPESPGDTAAKEFKMRWQAKPKPNLAQEAQDLRQQGKLEEALAKVKNAKTPDELSARAEVLLDQYLAQKLEKQEDLNKEDPQIKEARDDANKANNNFLVKKIDSTIDTVADLRKKLSEVNKALASAKGDIKGKDDSGVSELVAKYNGLTDTQKKLLDTINETTTKDNLKLQEEVLAGVNYLIGQYNILKTARKDLLDEINLALDKAKIKAEGKDVAAVKSLIEKTNDLLSAIDDQLKLAVPAIEKKDLDGVKSLVTQNNELANAVDKALVKLKEAHPSFVPEDKKTSAKDRLAAALQNIILAEKDARSKAMMQIAQQRMWLSEPPEKYLDNWIKLLQNRERKLAEEVNAAKTYAEWLETKEAKASMEAKAKAKLAIGLALRNHGQFEEAKEMLKRAQNVALGEGLNDLAKNAEKARNELIDPEKYYVPVAQRLFANDKDKALKTLEDGLKAMPKNPRLLRELATLQLEDYKSKKSPPEAEAEAVRRWALEAKQEAKTLNNPEEEAEALFVLGQLEEWLGQPQNLQSALKNYKEALGTTKTVENQGRYRVALFKLRERMPAAAAEPVPDQSPVPENPGKKTSQRTSEPARQDAPLVRPELDRTMVVLLLTCMQPPKMDLKVNPDDPNNKQRILDAEKQIKDGQELRKTKEKEGLKMEAEGRMMLGHAYFKMGNPREGLKNFAMGLGMYPSKDGWAKELDDWLQVYEEELFTRGTLMQANPSLAERYFGKGLASFHQRNYSEAEKQFDQAVKFFNQDARYHYYLGMALYLQNTKAKLKEAKRSFDLGGQLEAQSRPDSVRINASLERVQGPLRQVLSDYRQKALAGER